MASINVENIAQDQVMAEINLPKDLLIIRSYATEINVFKNVILRSHMRRKYLQKQARTTLRADWLKRVCTDRSIRLWIV